MTCEIRTKFALAILATARYMQIMTFDFLQDLTEDQRRELHAKLSYELRSLGETAFSYEETALWDTLRDTLPRQRGQTLHAFVDTFGRKRYQEAVAKLELLLDIAAPTPCRRPVKMAIRNVIVKCLIEYLVAAGIPANAKSALQAFHQLEYAVDRQYPGYIQAKLLHRIIPVIAA